jgi:hypothetical protein
MIARRFLVRSLLAVSISSTVAGAQTPAPTDDLPRVFLDCQANGCDDDFLRTELTWLNFVRDRTLAIVHILATSQSTGSGGTELTVAFIGLGSMSAKIDTITAISAQSDTFDERRQLVSRVISQGMLRFVANIPLASRLSVSYRAPTTGVVTSATRGARDKWNLWVFRVGGNTFLNGEETYKYYNLNTNVSASRITESMKITLGINWRRSREQFTYDTALVPGAAPLVEDVIKQKSSNANVLIAKSLGAHWSLGVQANTASDLRTNLKFGTRLGPAIEYDLFPYSQSTRRQLVFRYSLGIKALSYDDTTLYEKTRETLPDHRLIVASEATQPWGRVFGSVTANQYLTAPSKYRLDGFVFTEWRIVRGLNLFFEVGYSMLRDQINIRKGAATPVEVVTRQRQLSSGYSYFGSIGLNFTFGSAFSNVVNPRFTQNTGGFFF